eukprot:jgi/Chlat1/7725/Chrsp66S07195
MDSHASHAPPPQQEMGRLDRLTQWVVQNKLRTVGLIWATGVAGTLAYEFRQKHIPNSVKVIHARVYAQAITLGALAAAAAVETYSAHTREVVKQAEEQQGGPQ